MSQPCLKSQPLYPSDSPLNPFPFATCRDLVVSPHVHFPPSPALASTHTTHSPTVYDRAPIAVSPNLCALPERGGRVYTSMARTPTGITTFPGDYFHPRAFDAPGPPDVPGTPFNPPSLIPDLSPSESSDDNDGVSDSPPGPQVPPISRHFALRPPPSLVPHSHSQEGISNAHSPLLYSPSSAKEVTPKRRSPGRHRSGLDEFHRTKRASAFEVPSLDDGCLGGF